MHVLGSNTSLCQRPRLPHGRTHAPSPHLKLLVYSAYLFDFHRLFLFIRQHHEHGGTNQLGFEPACLHLAQSGSFFFQRGSFSGEMLLPRECIPEEHVQFMLADCLCCMCICACNTSVQFSIKLPRNKQGRDLRVSQ